jgi:hypothetical protein
MRDFALVCIGVAALVASFRKIAVTVQVVEQPKAIKVNTVIDRIPTVKPQWGAVTPEYDSNGKLTRWSFS